MKNISTWSKKALWLVPGTVFLFAVGLFSWYLGAKIPYISYLLICIGIGMLIANTTGLPDIIEKGIYDTHKVWLETGIVVLGARILLSDLVRVGPILLGIVILFLLIGLTLTQYLAAKFGLDQKFGSVLASGVSVCGVSAVIATGGGIEAKKKHIAYAIAAVLVFDVTTVFLWPAIGAAFSIPADVFGPWAGITSPSTGTTVAIGFIHSDQAGQLTTMTKMARNVFIGVWALMFTLYYARRGMTEGIENKASYLWDKFPKFVLGFLMTMALANVGILSEAQIGYMKNAYSWLFMMAFVGLGYDIDFADMARTGFKPLLVVLIVFSTVSLLSIGILYTVF
ncbi:putative sulfate exporter family transporter [Candidatus Bipolaricaulota bacterium]|nr:putative sulfate exporter family transporter [Candidatus Bipolaricaulota bacterium]